MLYLDYSATTPVDERVLDSYCKVTRDFIGNANSIHNLGVKSKELLMQATNQIADILNCHPKEIIFTSGASESNTTAIKGVAFKYANRGKHIITSKLEHKSVLEVMGFLSNIGYEVDFVNILDNGQIDLKNLEELIREDTILISICAVNSETGFKQPLKTIRQVINKKNPNVIFHSDLTQALGKTKFSSGTGPYGSGSNSYDINRIQKCVANYYNVTVEDLKSKKRVSNIAFPRHIAIYLSRQLTDESFPRIGMEFGGRDHSTVMSSCDRIESELKNNKQLEKVIEEIKKRLE